MTTRQGNRLRKGTYAHYAPTDTEGVVMDPSFDPQRPTISATTQNGFIDRTDSMLSFDNGTRTLTISPTGDAYYFWAFGYKFKKTEADTITIPDVEGLYFIYFDDPGEDIRTISLSYSTTVDLDLFFRASGYVAAIYWDADNNQAIIVNDERHLRMDYNVHTYNHQVFGSQWIYGLALGDMTVDGSGASNASAQFSVSSGAIRDEDIYNEITDGNPQELSPIAQIPLFYRSGASGLWRKITADNFPVANTGTGRAAYNQFTGATWQLTEVPNANFVLMHYFATNDISNPIIGIVGQSSYSTKVSAEAAASTEINSLLLGSLDILSPELCPIATVIWQTSDGYSNTVKSRIVSTDDGGDYVDWRSTESGRTAVGSATVVHNDTINRDATDAHPISAITNLQSSLDGKIDESIGGYSSGTVNKSLGFCLVFITNSSTFSISSAFNISAITRVSVGLYRVYFNSSPSVNTYIPSITSLNPFVYHSVPSVRTTDYFEFDVRNHSTGSLQDLGSFYMIFLLEDTEL